MKVKFIAFVAAMLCAATFAEAQPIMTPPRKVENPTICDLRGNPTKLPYWGEKNLFIFFVDPDAYLARNGSKDFAAEIEDNKRCEGPNIVGFGVINTADTKLPKNFIRAITRKRCERSGALALDDPKGVLCQQWDLGSCNNKFVLMIVSKEGEIAYFRKEERTPEGKEEFYKFIEDYR